VEKEMSPKEREDRKGEHRQADVDHASDARGAVKKCNPASNDNSIAGRLFRSRMAGTPVSRIDIALYANISERSIPPSNEHGMSALGGIFIPGNRFPVVTDNLMGLFVSRLSGRQVWQVRKS
jgi:hypothetical protein